MRRLGSMFLTVLVLAVAMFIAGCGGSSHTSAYKGAARPSLPSSQVVPSCASGNNHTMGECLPRPKSLPRPKGLALAPVSIPNGIQCVDLSNNNAVYGVSAYRIMYAHGIRCLIVKVVEGTGYVDPTAARMAHDAKAAGLIVGGYDFQHVCLGSATGEALLFEGHLRADGLLGKRTIAPEGDVEYGNGRCNARAWEDQWRKVVASYTGRAPGTYTGAWFWNPVFGSYWPAGSWAWISGYGVRWPFTPSGHSHVDMWQYADAGWNGVTHADLSVFLDGQAAFNRFANVTVPKPKPKPKPKPLTTWQKQWNAGYTRGYDVHWLRVHHRNVPPTTLKFTKVVQQGYNTGYNRVH